MVKSKKQLHPSAATHRGSVSASGSANFMEHTYCVLLHVGQAINFYGREMREGENMEKIIMTAALNTVDFEVEGTPSTTAETIIFNSNCIWECDMAGIKRIKTDHRPVKITFYSCNSSDRKTIGSLLLPLRGLPVLGVAENNNPLKLKLFWHKLTCLNNEFRSHKPEVLLLLAIVKKTLLYTKDFEQLMTFNDSAKKEHTPPLQSPEQSITANMIQSQANIYVQSLAQLGLLQVGNDPLVDCDIIEVVLQFKNIKNVDKFIKSLCHDKDEKVTEVLLMFDFLGSVTKINLKLNKSDTYEIKDVLGLRFKSSLRSMRLYFQRIFYLPFNLYIDGTSIANYRMDFGKLLPPDRYFADKRKYVHEGCFAFDRFGRLGSARELKPIIEYTFTVGILEVCWGQQDMQPGKQQLQLDQKSEQLDLQSVGSKAYTNEVPEDRAHDSFQDWHPASETASIRSLNVGAELSASDDSMSEASHLCRRKSTRLMVNNPMQEEELCNDEVPASNVNSCMFLKRPGFEDKQPPPDADDNNLPADISFESEFLDICNIVEDKTRDNGGKTASTENIKSNAKDIGLRRRLQNQQMKVNEWAQKFLEEEMQDQQQMPGFKRQATFRNGEEFEDENIDDSFLRLEKESEQIQQEEVKKDKNRKVTNTKAIEEINKLRTLSSKLLSLPNESNEIVSICPETTHDKKTTTIKKLALDKALKVKPKTVQNKKIVLNTEDFEHVNLPRHPVNTVKTSPQSNQTSQSPLKDELVKKPKKNFIVEQLLETDSVTDSEEQKANLSKKKSKHVTQSETQVCAKVIAKNAPSLKRTSKSKNDITLGARWVKVSKEQTKILNETEMYINDTCNMTQDAGPNDEQFCEWSRELNKPSRSKLQTNINCGLDMESSLDSSYMEKPQLERIVDNNSDSGESMPLAKHKTSRENELKHIEISLTSELDTTAHEENISIRKRAKRILKNNTSLQEFLDVERAISEQMSQNLPKEDNRFGQKIEKESSDVDSIQAKNHIKKRSTKSALFKQPNEDRTDKLCFGAKKSKTLIDDNAQVSRMELTVHMYDETKAADAAKMNIKCMDQSVNTDITNMDDSSETIIAAGRQLKDLMQQVQYIRGQPPLEKPKDYFNMEAHYEFKFKQIEQHIAGMEKQLVNFECRTQQIQENNCKLAEEKKQLNERIIQMEQQLAQLNQRGPSHKELQHVLNEMQLQNTRYLEMSKAKDQYKRSWRRCSKQVHALKLELYKKHMQEDCKPMLTRDIDLKSMITEDVMQFEREYGPLNGSLADLSFSGSGDGPPTLLKDLLLGLTGQTLDEHDSDIQVDSSL